MAKGEKKMRPIGPKTMEAAKAEAAPTLTEEELNGLRAVIGKRNELGKMMVDATVRLDEIKMAYYDCSEEQTKLTQQIEDKYGAVNINLQNGEIREITAEEDDPFTATEE